MIFAVIGDVRGDARAFTSVLNSIEEEGIHVVFQSGNLVLGGDSGAQVLRHVQEGNIEVVQGKGDAALVRFGRKQSGRRQGSPSAGVSELAACYESLGSADIEWLRSLPKKRGIAMDGFSILLCHGSPTNQSYQLSAETSALRFRREREASEASVIVCGGSDSNFSTQVDDTLFVMPGPMVPEAGACQWALVDLESAPWSVRFQTLALKGREDGHAGI
jgi:predicted phosphodiesterase